MLLVGSQQSKMPPRVSTGDRDAVLRQIRWCAAVRTLVTVTATLNRTRKSDSPGDSIVPGRKSDVYGCLVTFATARRMGRCVQIVNSEWPGVRTFRRRTVDELLPFGDRFAFAQGTMCQIGAYRRHLANTIKRSLLGDGDAALYLITIGT